MLKLQLHFLDQLGLLLVQLLEHVKSLGVPDEQEKTTLSRRAVAAWRLGKKKKTSFENETNVSPTYLVVCPSRSSEISHRVDEKMSSKRFFNAAGSARGQLASS